MKVLLSWLREFAPIEGDPVELGEQMSDLGMAVESLSRLETGALTNPTWKTLGAYANALRCRPRLLLGRRGARPPGPGPRPGPELELVARPGHQPRPGGSRLRLRAGRHLLSLVTFAGIGAAYVCGLLQ